MYPPDTERSEYISSWNSFPFTIHPKMQMIAELVMHSPGLIKYSEIFINLCRQRQIFHIQIRFFQTPDFSHSQRLIRVTYIYYMIIMQQLCAKASSKKCICQHPAARPSQKNYLKDRRRGGYFSWKKKIWAWRLWRRGVWNLWVYLELLSAGLGEQRCYLWHIQ